MEINHKDSHSVPFGYLLWFFGFTGAHRFYYGRPVSGTVWFCTFGLLGVGWIIDFFLIPEMDRAADLKFKSGLYNYNIAWVLLTFFGWLGLHRFYLGKWVTGVIWLFTFGGFTIGYIYDLWTLNNLISSRNVETESLSH